MVRKTIILLSAYIMAAIVFCDASRGFANEKTSSLQCARGLKAFDLRSGQFPPDYPKAMLGLLRMNSKSAAESTALENAEAGTLSDLYACIASGVLNFSTISVINSVLSGSIDTDDWTSGAFAKGTSEVVSQCQVAIAVMTIPFAQELDDSKIFAVTGVLGERAGRVANILLEIETGSSPGQPGRAKSFFEGVDERVLQLIEQYNGMPQDSRNAAYAEWGVSCARLGVDLSLASALLEGMLSTASSE